MDSSSKSYEQRENKTKLNEESIRIKKKQTNKYFDHFIV